MDLADRKHHVNDRYSIHAYGDSDGDPYHRSPPTSANDSGPQLWDLCRGCVGPLPSGIARGNLKSTSEKGTRSPWIKGAGHTEWMEDEHPTFRTLIEKLAGWFRSSMPVRPAKTRR